ncbi:daunorubicin resistance ABC transporter, ATP-binding protein [Desulfitobacterium hafniense DP7]|uniref:Daunorubicin resistance ABC transporter, ATP-binding protein n=1 Tax=Desulfitobacterium hafniense DP7 TaxID=537010 RepID=G9XQQ8_DESHA|nr:daunorubicin resistance protein DrrA family ABC transporter ATP-binding protein [Desulfitobacterium hafniense]EHL06008.1 daunorubicin resistance ABC transporter, ATP-binding protein [Desulfitobacterium hafniense DP7]
MSNAIEITDLRKSFSVKAKGRIIKVEAVRGLTLGVKRGEIFGFLGPNGAGKTTTLRMLTTLLPIDEGKGAICGYDLVGRPQEVRRHIGYVSQLGGADWEATGRENLILAGQLYGMKRHDAEQRTEELLAVFELVELADRVVRTYSGGQRRRLEIALGMINRPEVLFLDEPTTGLDPQNRANLWEQIRKLKEGGTTIFLTTHYLDEADALSDRLAIMDCGIIVAEGTPQELKEQISGDVIQIRLADDRTQQAKRLFDKVSFINEIRLEGEDIYLYAKNGAQVLPRIFEMLEAEGVQTQSVSIATPSLDDVFLKQTGRLLRDGKEDIA